MLKKICLIGICLWGFSANATCIAGDILQGTESGTFCISKIQMNWWSAHSWCKANGGKFATVTDACLGRLDACPNLSTLPRRVWLATPFKNTYAWSVKAGGGFDNGGDRRQPLWVICTF